MSSDNHSDPLDFHEWRGRLNEVLNRERDPIGVWPDGVLDEYVPYANAIAGMIIIGAADDELMAYLDQTIRITMGLQLDKKQACECNERTIAAIRALGPSPRHGR